jgi:NAD(P)-dependent dehydrogenase (short-subunit alcohol dehydrogenase family)
MDSKQKRLHGLVNNAGIMAVANGISEDGFEYQWQTNYLSHWLLTFLLTPVMELTATTVPAGTVRIVNVSSSNHKMAPPQGIDFEDINLQGPGPSSNPWVRYGQSKLGNYLHALSLHGKLNKKGIWTASLHPGIVDTNLSANIQMFAVSILSSRPVIWLLRRVGFMLNTDQGSWTQLFAIAGRGFDAALSGSYLEPIAKKGTVKMPRGVTSEDLQNQLWEWTEREMKAKGFIS